MKLQVANLGKVAITVEEEPWSINKAYDRLTIVEDNFTSYISRIAVPKGQPLVNNRHYWVPFGTRNGALSVNSFTILSSESQLPLTEDENDGPYLINGVGYFWVGTQGNAVDGKYQTIEFQGPKGDDGKSAYDLYKQQGGTLGLNQWLASLKGEPGNTGKSAYEMYLAQMRETTGNPNFFVDIATWLESLNGEDGKSAYELWLESPLGDPTIDEQTWLLNLKGTDGRDAKSPIIGNNGNWFTYDIDTNTWIDTKKPARGEKGDSFTYSDLTPNQIESLRGPRGYQPYIGPNGNWFSYDSNGQPYDTGQPSRGEPGMPGSGNGSGVYVQDNVIKIPISTIVTGTPTLLSPVNNSVPGALHVGHKTFTILVQGSNLTKPITVINETPEVCNITFNGVQAVQFTISANDANNGTNVSGVYGLTLNQLSQDGSCSIKFTSEEFDDVYVAYTYTGFKPGDKDDSYPVINDNTGVRPLE